MEIAEKTYKTEASFALLPNRDEKKAQKSIYETPDGRYVIIMGVRVKKAEVPYVTRQSVDFKYTSTSLGILRDIATSYSLGLPILISGDSGIGKTAALKKFCELIGAKLHLINVNEDTTVRSLMSKPVPVDGHFEYVDGPITEALRAGPGELHIVVLDEINTMRSEQASGLHAILDAWQGGGEVSTWKPAGGGTYEKLRVPKDRVYFSMTMNPAGAGFMGRKMIDDAFARRCHVAQHVRDDAKQMREFRDLNEGKEVKIDESEYLYSRETPLSQNELTKDRNYTKLHNAYIRFHKTLIHKIQKREIAKKQTEGLEFGGIDMDRRVHDFLRNFYTPENGTLLAVFQRALQYFYVQPFMEEVDRERVRNMILMFATEDGAEDGAESATSQEREYTQPPALEIFELQGHGAMTDAHRELINKKLAGQAELNYVWGLMQRYNKPEQLNKNEKKFLDTFKREGILFNFFGAVRPNGSIPCVYWNGSTFQYGEQTARERWIASKDRAVLLK